MSEQWTPIDGHPGYKVSSDGRILGKHKRILRTSYVSGGLMFTVKRNGEDTTLRVARVVGKAFCPDADPAEFVETARKLRVLNDVRKPAIGEC